MKIINLVIAVFLTALVQGQSLSVDEILEKVENNSKIESAVSAENQTITTSKGQTRTLSSESYTVGDNEKTLSIYTAPARVEGDKILMLNGGDDIWFYTPKTDRVRHLASNAKKQKVQGSDFSYEDMEKRDYKTDFTSKLAGSEKIDGVDCFIVEAIPTETGPSYSKLIFWIDKTKFIQMKCEFYDDSSLLKTLISSRVKQFSNIWIATKMVMTNNQTGSKTMMEIVGIEVNVPIDENMFTTNYLKQK